MSSWLRRSAAIVGVTTMAGGLTIGAASRRWQRASERLMDRVARGATRRSEPISLSLLAPLPAPVRRYFRLVLRDGQSPIRAVRLTQEGTFRIQESADPAAGWQPFTATESFSADPPGFVWDARIRVAPLIDVRARDTYIEGRASMLGAVLGLLPVVGESDTEELREGALQRYLAESVWFPTALLPRPGLLWAEIDDAHARATLTDGGTTVSLDFAFAPAGEISETFSPGRLRAVPGEQGRYERQPWGGRYRHYEDRGGVRIPLEAEVYWVSRGREQPYYRGRIVRIDFDGRPVP